MPIKSVHTSVIPPAELLARIVMGSLKADIKDSSVKKPALSIRLDPDLYSELEFFRNQSGKSMTELVQLLLSIGISDVRKHMELDGQLDLEGVKK